MNNICHVCGGKLRSFRMMYLRTMYWYTECKNNVPHYKFPSKYGFDSLDDLNLYYEKTTTTTI